MEILKSKYFIVLKQAIDNLFALTYQYEVNIYVMAKEKWHNLCWGWFPVSLAFTLSTVVE